MNRQKKLLNNFVIFFTGSFGSKLLQFLMVPFYTAVLTPQEFGAIDVLQTISTLMIPIFSLTIAESVFRYGMESDYDKGEVFSVGIFIAGIGSICMIIITAVLSFFMKDSRLLWLMIFMSIFNMLRTVTSQFMRAIGKVKQFTIDNIVQTCGIIALNLLFLLVYKWGTIGYLLGYVLGNCISFLFGMVACRLWKYISFHNLRKITFRTMLRFSIPLIPNTICWWISSSTDKIMLTAWVGTFANGLYSVAHKVPSIITIVIGVFIQAWQISANEEFDKTDNAQFYGEIFEILAFLSFAMASFFVLLAKVEIRILADGRYFDAWKCMIVLIVGIAFFTFAQFFGTIYTANRKTEMAFVTNLIAAIVNIIGNYFLIPRYDIIGAAMATSFSYLVFWLVRMWNTRNIIKMKFSRTRLMVCSIILIVQATVQILEVRYWIIYAGLCMVGIVCINAPIIKRLIEQILGIKRC